MAKKPDIHVVHRPEGGWAVQREGGQRPSAVTDTKREAVERAKDLGRKDKVEVVTHGKDGRIQDSGSYGKDPCPPRDKKH
jgi:uncharacterized protein YdaT